MKQYWIQGYSLNFSSADSIVAGYQVTVLIITFLFLCFLFLFEVSLPYYGFHHSQVILTIEHYYFTQPEQCVVFAHTFRWSKLGKKYCGLLRPISQDQVMTRVVERFWRTGSVLTQCNWFSTTVCTNENLISRLLQQVLRYPRTRIRRTALKMNVSSSPLKKF